MIDPSQSPIQTAALKGRFPFRLGTSSYIIPADILPNVEALAPWVDDVELVLFESDEFSNLPDGETIARLGALASENDLTYTVHMPLDTQLGSADEAERESSVQKCLRVYRLTQSLRPHAWVLHFHGERRGAVPAEDVDAWVERLDRSAQELLAAGMPAELLAVETLDYPFELVWPVVEARALSVCVDIGHLLLQGVDPVKTMERYQKRCRVVHLHGVREGKDHVDVGALDDSLLGDLLDVFQSPEMPPRVVTLEVFSQPDFEVSMRVLEDVWT